MMSEKRRETYFAALMDKQARPPETRPGRMAACSA